MSHIIDGKFVRSDLAKNSSGGTELMGERIAGLVDQTLLQECQIIVGRQTHELQEDKVRIAWFHDLPGDQAVDQIIQNKHLYHKLVFVSNWQMQKFIDHYGLEWDNCVVIRNGIEPLPYEYLQKPKDGPIKLGYWSTPHRGLGLLVPVFEELQKKHDIELHVYSSFSLYGWDQRDKEFDGLFDHCKKNPKIFLHGAKPNDEIREALQDIEILAYPSIWPETSCLVLMEAMSAGILAVHSNLAALYETGCDWTRSYQYHQDPKKHCHVFYGMLDRQIETVRNQETRQLLGITKSYADAFYNINNKKMEWEALIQSLVGLDRKFPGEMFEFHTS